MRSTCRRAPAGGGATSTTHNHQPPTMPRAKLRLATSPACLVLKRKKPFHAQVLVGVRRSAPHTQCCKCRSLFAALTNGINATLRKTAAPRNASQRLATRLQHASRGLDTLNGRSATRRPEKETNQMQCTEDIVLHRRMRLRQHVHSNQQAASGRYGLQSKWIWSAKSTCACAFRTAHGGGTNGDVAAG